MTLTCVWSRLRLFSAFFPSRVKLEFQFELFFSDQYNIFLILKYALFNLKLSAEWVLGLSLLVLGTLVTLNGCLWRRSSQSTVLFLPGVLLSLPLDLNTFS